MAKRNHDSSKITRPIAVLSLDEESRLLDFYRKGSHSSRDERLSCRDHLMVLLMLDAGLRVGEVASLRVRQLFFAGEAVGAIAIEDYQTKTYTSRVIPVTVRLSDHIEIYFKEFFHKLLEAPNLTVFQTGYPRHPLSVRAIQIRIHKLGIAALGRPLHPHIFRHTFATKLMRTCSIRVVQMLLGHKSIESTQVYTHPNSSDLQTAINTLNQNKGDVK